jgi:hypothetical protein
VPSPAGGAAGERASPEGRRDASRGVALIACGARNPTVARAGVARACRLPSTAASRGVHGSRRAELCSAQVQSFFSRQQSHDSSGPEKPRLDEIRGERTSSRSRGTSARAGSFGRVHLEIRAIDVLAARGRREYRARIFYRIPHV